MAYSTLIIISASILGLILFCLISKYFVTTIQGLRKVVTTAKNRLANTRLKTDLNFNQFFAGLFCIVLFIMLLGADLNILSSVISKIFPLGYGNRGLFTVPFLKVKIEKSQFISLAFMATGLLLGHLMAEGLGNRWKLVTGAGLDKKKPLKIFFVIAIAGSLTLILTQIAGVRLAIQDATTTPEATRTAQLITACVTLGTIILGLAIDNILSVLIVAVRLMWNFVVSVGEAILAVVENVFLFVENLCLSPGRIRQNIESDKNKARKVNSARKRLDWYKRRYPDMTPQDLMEVEWCLQQLEILDPHSEDYGLIKQKLDVLEMISNPTPPQQPGTSPTNPLPIEYRRALSYFSIAELRSLRGDMLGATLSNDQAVIRNLIEGMATAGERNYQQAFQRRNDLANLIIKFDRRTFEEVTDPSVIKDDDFSIFRDQCRAIESELQSLPAKYKDLLLKSTPPDTSPMSQWHYFISSDFLDRFKVFAKSLAEFIQFIEDKNLIGGIVFKHVIYYCHSREQLEKSVRNTSVLVSQLAKYPFAAGKKYNKETLPTNIIEAEPAVVVRECRRIREEWSK